MSTKIYSAYRIKKSTDIRVLFNRAKEIAREHVKENYELLYAIHGVSTITAVRKFKKEPDNWFLKRVLEKDKEGEIDDLWICQCMDRAALGTSKDIIDINFSCSIFYDRKYWYLKFFPNYDWQYKVLHKIEEEFELEDYHYQNSTDRPDGITRRAYNARSTKWDKLCEPDGNFRSGLSAVIFDSFEFQKLISKYYYTGEKDLYKHLAYKFDKKIKDKKI